MHDPGVPEQPLDLGVGERLILVVGGVFPTREGAEAAARSISIGELQGFYVAPVGQFEGLDEALAAPRRHHALVSAFRTRSGAREFLDLVRAAGATGMMTPRLRNLGDRYVGLGQEASPDGTGPLQEPLPGVSVP